MITNDSTPDLADCLARLRKQDGEAARSLVEYLYPTVIRIVHGNLPRGANAEELTRKIFAGAFAKLEQFNSEIPLDHWVSRIAVNHCLGVMHAQKPRTKWRMANLSERESAALDALTAAVVHDPDKTHLTGARELADRLLEALRPKERLLMRMMETEELSVEEVQEVTGWSSKTIRARSCRARRKLNWLYWTLRLKERPWMS